MKNITQITCVCCSNNCVLSVDEEHGNAITGNRCRQGILFAEQELANPTRMVNAFVAVSSGERDRCPVHTSRPIPRETMYEAVEQLRKLTVPAPVWVNQTILENVCGTGVSFVASESVMEEDPS